MVCMEVPASGYEGITISPRAHNEYRILRIRFSFYLLENITQFPGNATLISPSAEKSGAAHQISGQMVKYVQKNDPLFLVFSENGACF
jgi:hypothetical protein